MTGSFPKKGIGGWHCPSGNVQSADILKSLDPRMSLGKKQLRDGANLKARVRIGPRLMWLKSNARNVHRSLQEFRMSATSGWMPVLCRFQPCLQAGILPIL